MDNQAEKNLRDDSIETVSFSLRKDQLAVFTYRCHFDNVPDWFCAKCGTVHSTVEDYNYVCGEEGCDGYLRPSSKAIRDLNYRLHDASVKRGQLTAERDHWKANHENQVRRARILIERTDMPIERVAAYNRMIELETQRDQLLAALEKYEAAFDNLFGQCASNPITSAWGKEVNMSMLNEAHQASRAAIAAVKGGAA